MIKGIDWRKINIGNLSPINNNQLAISFCNRSNSFIFQMYFHDIERNPIRLYGDNVLLEKEKMDLFIITEAKVVHLVQENGRTINIPLSEFDYNREEGYLEHSTKNIAINIFKPLGCSYTYTYNSNGEIENKSPIYDLVIY